MILHNWHRIIEFLLLKCIYFLAVEDSIVSYILIFQSKQQQGKYYEQYNSL